MDTNSQTNAALLTTVEDRAPKRNATAVAHDVIRNTAQAAHRAIDRAGPATERFFDMIRRRTAENPLTALAIAAFVGLVLGRIL